MRVVQLRIIVNALAALIGIFGIILMHVYPDLKELFLSIEVILLPSLYITFNTYTEELVKLEYRDTLEMLKNEIISEWSNNYIKKKQ